MVGMIVVVASVPTYQSVVLAVGPHFVQNVSDVNVTEYSLASLNCSAVSAPAPTIKWLFDSSPVTVSSQTKAVYITETSKFVRNSVLTLSNVSRLDIGFYQCIAKSGISRVVTEPAFLNVFCTFLLIKCLK